MLNYTAPYILEAICGSRHYGPEKGFDTLSRNQVTPQAKGVKHGVNADGSY